MLISVNELKTGMILMNDVYDKDGKMLVPKNSELKDSIINKLKEFEIKNVSITNENASYDINLKSFNNSYNEALKKVNESFNMAKYKKIIDINDFEDTVDNIIDNSKVGRNVITYMKLIGQKDEYTLQHSINVSILSILMGKWLGFNNKEIKELGVAAMLHDIGKVLIPDQILNKPSSLTKEEFCIMKNHPRYGYQIINNSNIESSLIKNIVLTHHERLDGNGYPFGLKEYQINDNTRIVSICDVYDAITTERVYKRKQNPLIAFKELNDESYRGLDKYLTKIFINNSIIAYSGCDALLSNGVVGRIVKIDSDNPLKPWITIGDKFIDLKEVEDIEVIDIV